jgi:hypothetical protein
MVSDGAWLQTVADDFVDGASLCGDVEFLSSLGSRLRRDNPMKTLHEWLLHGQWGGPSMPRVSGFKDTSCSGRARVFSQAWVVVER